MMHNDTIFVSAGSDVAAAVAAARPGDVIELGAGNHGTFNLKYVDLGGVTLRSADPDDPATISRMNLTNVSGLHMSDLVFDLQVADHESFNISTKPFRILRSSDISISNSLFDGEIMDAPGAVGHGAGMGFGLSVSWVHGFTIENSEFRDFYRGAVFGGGSNVVVSGNDMHSLRMDGLNFSAVEGVTIENNYIHDFRRSESSADHADFIQFWTNGDKRPSTDIIIRDNILDAGDGDWTQSIFMRNEEAERDRTIDPGNQEMFYQNVLIENNVIFNAHVHGIMLGEANGVVIRNNVLMPHAEAASAGMGASISTPRIRVNPQSNDVVIEGNVSLAVMPSSDRDDWTVTRNVSLQDTDPQRADYIDANFVAAGAARPNGDLAGLTVVPGSLVYVADAGLPKLHEIGTADGAQALFRTAPIDRALNHFSFDGNMCTGSDGNAIDPDLIVWDLGDGTTATGATVSHVYGAPGVYDVVLHVTDAFGATSTQHQTVNVLDANILSLGADTGLWDMRESQRADYINSQDFDLVETDGGMALRVGDGPVSLGRNTLNGYFLSNTFDLTFDIKADGPESQGELFRIHGNIRAHVNAEGALAVVFNPEDSPEVKLVIPDADILNGDWHRINIAFDGDEGWFRATVGDNLVAEVEASGRVKPPQSWDLSFGNPWGKPSFSGLVRDFDLNAGVVVEPVQESTPEPFSGPDPYTVTFDTPSAGEQVDLGRLIDFEDERALGIEVEFTPGENSSGRLAWNHMALGLEAGDDWVGMRVGLADGSMQGFVVRDIDLNDEGTHRLSLVADADADVAQLWLNDILLHEVTGRDIDFNSAQDRQWGWTLGGAFDKHVYNGDIHSFRLWALDPDTDTFTAQDAGMITA